MLVNVSVIACPSCGKACLSKESHGVQGIEFDACPHCLFMRYYDPIFCDSTNRVLMWQEILGEQSCSLSELRDTLKGYELENDAPTPYRYQGRTQYELTAATKLGGLWLFSAYDACRFSYQFQYPSTRDLVKTQKQCLQNWFQFSDSYTPKNLFDYIEHNDPFSSVIPF